jgi:hypothetical protein
MKLTVLALALIAITNVAIASQAFGAPSDAKMMGKQSQLRGGPKDMDLTGCSASCPNGVVTLGCSASGPEAQCGKLAGTQVECTDGKETTTCTCQGDAPQCTTKKAKE